MRRRLVVLASCLVGVIAAPCRADEEVPLRRASIGLQFGVLDLPSGHLGIPVGGLTEDAAHLPVALVGRYEINRRFAANVGLGLPTGAMGLGGWIGFEFCVRLVADKHRWVALEVYEDSGLQLGFAGPDYYARHDHDFVGYDYAFAGPLAFALRLPAGVRASLWQNRTDVYVETVEVLALTPSVEALFELAIGAHVHW